MQTDLPAAQPVKAAPAFTFGQPDKKKQEQPQKPSASPVFSFAAPSAKPSAATVVPPSPKQQQAQPSSVTSMDTTFTAPKSVPSFVSPPSSSAPAQPLQSAPASAERISASDILAKVRSIPVKDLKPFTFETKKDPAMDIQLFLVRLPEFPSVRDRVASVSPASLTKFSFDASVASSSAPPATSGGFNWAAAGLSKPAAPTNGQWTCDACMVKNPADKTACISCETSKPGASTAKPFAPPPAPPASSGGFNWAAAGLSKPAAPTNGQWTCDACMVKNPADKTACISCETSKPGASTAKPFAPPPAPPASSGGFNWAAAGLSKPAAPTNGQWTCDACMVKNPADKTACISCETPKKK